MSDLISREQTHELLSERMRDTALYNACEDAGTILIDIVQNRLEKWLNELPSAEPVIRCKDCEHDGYCCRLSSRTPNDYCSHAKRRPMSDLISRLSELRSQYNCFNESERDAYHTLSEAIEALKVHPTLDDVSNAYENGYKQGEFEAQQWISVSDHLPEYDKDVLCYTDAEEFIVGYRVDNWGQDAWITGEFGNGEFDAIAWMPLPDPYEEKR